MLEGRMELNVLYKSLKERLSDKNEALAVIHHVTGLEEADLIARPDQPVTDGQQKQIEGMVERRLAGEPLSRIIGQKSQSRPESSDLCSRAFADLINQN